jgi:hypothetical protein
MVHLPGVRHGGNGTARRLRTQPDMPDKAVYYADNLALR